MKFFLRVSSVLAGLLVIGMIMLTIGQPERETNPSAENYGPSGLAALADLLRQSGYEVRLDRRERPRIRKDELAIAMDVEKEAGAEFLQEPPQFEGILASFVSEGGTLLTGTAPKNFNTASKSTSPVKASLVDESGRAREDGPHAQVSAGTWTVANLNPDPMESEVATVWLGGNQKLVQAYAYDAGLAYALGSSLFLSNRFLDKAENAKFALSLVSALAPEKKVVFVEAAAGNIVEPTLLEELGVWVKYGWVQFVFLAILIGYAAGKRFGLPILDVTRQRGQRDMVEAVGFLYHRSRADATALGAILRNADRDLRKSLKLSFDAPQTQRDDQLPDTLLAALDHAARVASIEVSPESQVLAAARRVEREVEAFIGSRTIIRNRRRKAS